MLTTRHGVRVLGPQDLPDFVRLVGLDPVVNVFADYRARTTNLEPRWLGGEMWGRYLDGRLTAACHVGANRHADASANSKLVRGLTNGRSYLFRIRAVNAAGASPWSATMRAKPVAP